MNTTPSGFNLWLDTEHGCSNWHLPRSMQLLSFKHSPCRGLIVHWQGACNCWIPGREQQPRQTQSPAPLPGAARLTRCLLPLPTAKEPTSPDWGLQGSTGRRKVGRRSKHMWEIQMEEEQLGVKQGVRTVIWELQVFDLYNSLTKYMSLSLTCSKVPFSYFSITVLNVTQVAFFLSKIKLKHSTNILVVTNLLHKVKIQKILK